MRRRYLGKLGLWSGHESIVKYEGSEFSIGIWGLPALDSRPMSWMWKRDARGREISPKIRIARPLNRPEMADLRGFLARVRASTGGLTREPDLTGRQPLCPGARACKVGCFARAERYLYPNVYKNRFARLEFTTHPDFVQTLSEEITREGYELYRIHDSGDFYSRAYRDAWFRIIDNNPFTRFWCYTKSIGLFKSDRHTWRPKPLNLHVVLSVGSSADHWIDPVRDPHSFVFSSHEELYAAGYADATNNDADVVFDSHLIGLVYHGETSLAVGITSDADKARRMPHKQMLRETARIAAGAPGRMAERPMLPAASRLWRMRPGQTKPWTEAARIEHDDDDRMVNPPLGAWNWWVSPRGALKDISHQLHHAEVVQEMTKFANIESAVRAGWTRMRWEVDNDGLNIQARSRETALRALEKVPPHVLKRLTGLYVDLGPGQADNIDVARGESLWQALKDWNPTQDRNPPVSPLHPAASRLIRSAPGAENPPTRREIKYLDSLGLSHIGVSGHGQMPGGLYLGSGHYTTAYRVGDDVYLFTKEDEYMKDVFTDSGAGLMGKTMPHLPQVERLEDPPFPRKLYKMPWYEPLKASHRAAWADYLRLKKARDEAWDEVIMRGRGRPRVDGHRVNDRVVREIGEGTSLGDALRALADAAMNYGAGVTFEFAPRNLGVDRQGLLVLRDILFDVEKLEQERHPARPNPPSPLHPGAVPLSPPDER